MKKIMFCILLIGCQASTKEILINTSDPAYNCLDAGTADAGLTCEENYYICGSGNDAICCWDDMACCWNSKEKWHCTTDVCH